MVLLTGCVSVDRARPGVEVTRLTGRDAWRVRYSLPHAVEAVCFTRPGQTFRSSSWRVLSPESASWIVDDDREVLHFSSPQREFVVEFPSDYARRDKGYDFTIRFSDGARLLYTGYLSIAPSHRWSFRGDAGEWIVVRDRAARSPVRWHPREEPEDGTYIYFGNEKPVQSPRMSVLVDRGLPDWIERDVLTVLPRQFDHFAERLQTELNFRPVVFIAWNGPPSRGRTFKGGTLEGLMAVSLEGEQWVAPTKDAHRGWFHHLAHESFHFWDGEMFEPKPNDAEWLSESAAEYMAVLASRAEGLIDDGELDRAINDYATRCQSFSRTDFRSFYTCGVVVQALADQASGGRIAEIYRRTFVQHYTTERFLENIDDATAAIIRNGATGIELKRAWTAAARPDR